MTTGQFKKPTDPRAIEVRLSKRKKGARRKAALRDVELGKAHQEHQRWKMECKNKAQMQRTERNRRRRLLRRLAG